MEISSSNFHLAPNGDVTMLGKVTADEGAIAAWNISGNNLASSGDGGIRLNGNGDNAEISINSHTFGNEGIQMGYNSGNPRFYAGSGSFDFLRYDTSNGVNIKTTRFLLDTDHLDIDSSTNDGKIALGTTPPTAYNSGNGIYVDGTGKALIGSSTGSMIQFDGTNLILSSSVFLLGDSGSAYVSGSNSNIEISSSNFYLKADGTLNMGAGDFTIDTSGNVTMAGSVTATTGTIGGFHIGSNALWGGNAAIDNAATQIVFSGIQDGDTPKFAMGNTADDITLVGGTGLYVDGDGDFKVGSPTKYLKYTVSGNALEVKAGGLEIDASNIEISSTQASMSLGEGKIRLVGGGTSTMTLGTGAASVTMSSNGTDSLISMGSKTNFSSEGSGTAGILIGMDASNPQAEFVKDSSNYLIFDDGIDIKTDTLKASGSNIILEAPRFFLGGTNQYVSGSNGNIEISSSAFHLTPEGNVTASNIILGDKSEGDYLQFVGGTLTVQGDVTANEIRTPATIAGSPSTGLNASSSISSTGLARFVSASIGGFHVSDSQINDTDSNLILKSSGHITGSKVLFTAGKIAGWTINGNLLKNQDGDLRLNGRTENPKITIGTHTVGSGPGIQLGYDSGGTLTFFAGQSATDYIKYTAGTGVDIKTDTLKASGSNIILEAPKFYLGDSSNYISGSDGNLKIFSSGETTLSGSNINLKTPHMFLGATGSAYVSSSDGDLEISSSTFFLKSDGTLNIGAGDFTVDTSGNVVMAGSVTATTGTIGGWTINSTNISSSGMYMDSSNKKLIIKSATFGSSGIQAEYNSGTPRFYVGDGSNRYLKFDGTDVDIKSAKFILDTDNLDINSTTKRITVTDGSNERVRIGEVGGTKYGIKIFDGSGTAASDEIVHLSDAKYQIASWSLSPTQITSENLVLDSSGIIQTSDFASGVKGWRITSANNGEAEFEKVTVRGTLATTVFEKESVNAVGGQLYVANSTIISSSTQISATETTWSVANVGGFTGSYFNSGSGEILSVKKVTDTGFQTEYVLIQSASRDYPSSNTDFMGKLYVVRGYSGSSPTDSGSLGDEASSATTYENGQVIVSTGRLNTGYIRLNANPNDSTTPYIDIVERTGSAIYDVSLKARLGDLSGLSSGLLYGNSSPGFGLFTENVFLQGAITATTGSFDGIVHIRTDSTNQIQMGTNVNSTHDGIQVDTNNFWYTTGDFRAGGASSNYFYISGSSIDINADTFDLSTSTVKIKSAQNSGMLSLGSTPNLDVTGSNSGIYMDGTGDFLAYGDAENFFKKDGTALTINAATFGLGTATMIISSSANSGTIRMGSNGGPISYTANTAGIYMDGTGKFQVYGDAANYLRFDGATVDIKTDEIDIYASGGTNKMRLLADGTNTPSIALGPTLNSTVAGTNAGIYMDGTGDFLAYGDSKNYFRFDVGGTPVLDIKAETAYLSGSSITLKSPEFFLGDTSNYISGSGGAIDIAADTFSLGTTTLVISSSVNSGTLSLGATPNTTGSGTNKGVYMDGTGDFLAYTNATNYIRKSQNKLDIKADTFDLATTTMIMDSGVNSGKIALGNTPPSSVAYTSNAGIYMDGTGDFLVRGDNDNYIKMYSNTIDIKSEVFGLGTPTMVISSSVNGGTIRMGANGGPISQTANTAGTYIDGNGKFQVFGDSSNYLRIDGSTIDMRTTTFYLSGSDITLKSPDFFLGDSSNYISGSDGNLAIYSTGNTTLSGSSITLATPHLFMGATGSAYVSASDGELEISSSKFLLKSDGSMNAGAGAFTLDTSGNVTISGSISSSEGNIAGWNMTSYILSSHDENGGLKLDSYNKQFGIRTGSHVDTTIIELGRIGGSVGSPQFGIEGLDSSDITKTLFKFGEAGNEIAGWTITDAEIKSGTNISLNSTDKALYINNSTFGNDGIQLMYNGGNPKMYVGDGSNEFLKFDGSSLSIQTQDAHISGSSITLKSPDFYLGDTSNYISGSGGNLAISSSKFYLASDGSINAGVGAFTVSSDGNVFISGSVSSSIGNIGGWTIDADEIKAGGVKLDSDSSDGQIKLGSATALNTGDGIYMDGTGDFRAGDANGHRLEWNGSGVIVSSSDFFLGDATNFISGSGGAVNIESQEFDLNTNNLRVSSSYGGTIAMGATIPKSISGSGVFLSGSGDFLAGNHAGNKIQFNKASNAIVMKSNAFSLDATTIVIDSSANNGKIALGASPNTSAAGTNAGIYMDGTGDFLAYADSSNYLKFDQAATPKLQMKAESFYLGSTSQYISGSQGNLEISSSGFYLDNTGNATMQGKITATDGTIGGFVIGSGQLNSVQASSNSAAVNISGSGVIVAGDITNPGVQSATYMGVLRENGGSSGVSGSLYGGMNIGNRSYNKLKIPTMNSGDHIGFMVDGGNFWKNVQGETQFRVGAMDNYPYLAYKNDTGELYISGSAVDIQIGSGGGGSFKVSGSVVNLQSNKMFFGAKSSAFISASSGNLQISSSNFHLAENGDVTMKGVVTADTGYLGGTSGWTIASGKITSTGIGVATTTGDGTYAFWAGDNTPASAEFSVTHAGALKATSGTVGNWTIGSNTLSGNNISLDQTNKKIQVGNDDNSITIGIENSVDGFLEIKRGGLTRMKIDETLFGSRPGVLMHNNIMFFSSSLGVDTNTDYGGLWFGREKISTWYKNQPTQANYMPKPLFNMYSKPLVTNAGSGYGLAYPGTGLLSDVAGPTNMFIHSKVENWAGLTNYASMNVMTQFDRINLDDLTSSTTSRVGIGIRSVVSSISTQNASDDCYIVAVHGAATTQSLDTNGSTYIHNAIDADKAISGFFSGTRFIVAKQGCINIESDPDANTQNDYTWGGVNYGGPTQYLLDINETTATSTIQTHIYPQTSATYDLGSSTYRWRNVYTTDLQLSNLDKEKGNKVDGTKGDWTLQEGEEDLFVINNISGKKYKIALIPQDDESDNKGDP